MMEKHYDSNYLHDTMSLLMEVKRLSYEPFLKLVDGNVVDIGCGMGEDVFKMSVENESNTSYTGIDHDSTLIDEARKKIGFSQANLSYECKDLVQNPLPEITYDGIRAERLFQHITKSNELLLNCYNALKLGGVFLTIESDWAGINIYSSNHKMELAVREYLIEKKVVNGLASRNLVGEVKNAGFKIENLQILPFTVSNLDLANSVVKLETIIKEAAAANYCTEEDSSSFYNELVDLNSKKLFRLQMNMIFIQAIKTS
tara:strand:+ start:177 stop:950 length:774 start_codon:yes stop_codon:yes gene_type:complete